MLQNEIDDVSSGESWQHYQPGKIVQNSFKDVQWTSSFLQRWLIISLFFIPKYQTRFFFLIQPRPHGYPHVLHLDNPKNTPNNLRQLQSTKRWSASDPMCRLLGLGHRRVMEVYEHHMHHMHHSLTNLRNTHIDLYRWGYWPIQYKLYKLFPYYACEAPCVTTHSLMLHLHAILVVKALGNIVLISSNLCNFRNVFLGMFWWPAPHSYDDYIASSDPTIMSRKVAYQLTLWLIGWVSWKLEMKTAISGARLRSQWRLGINQQAPQQGDIGR